MPRSFWARALLPALLECLAWLAAGVLAIGIAVLLARWLA